MMPSQHNTIDETSSIFPSASMNQKTIAVVLPVYNISTTHLLQSIEYCMQLAQMSKDYHWYFQFVDDGSASALTFPSPQNSPNSIHPNYTFAYHRYAVNQGKGYAIRCGIHQLNTNASLFMHCDWDFPFGLQPLFNSIHLLQTCDVVWADRGEQYLQALPNFRKKLTIIQRLFNTYVLGLKAHDTQAGFKAFTTKGKDVFLRTTINEFLFDTQFIKLAEKQKLSLCKLDVQCRQDVHFNNFKASVLVKEMINLIRLIF
jgi:glycosyltransferase involved in cell wall biosynthesis